MQKKCKLYQFGACRIDDCDTEHNAVHVAGVRISEKIVFQPTTANDHVAVEPQCTSNTRTEWCDSSIGHISKHSCGCALRKMCYSTRVSIESQSTILRYK